MHKIEYTTIEDINTILYDFKVLFAFHSNKIENDKITYHDTREIFENGRLNGYSGDLKTIFEILNQKNCYDYLLDKLVEKEMISISLIKNIHKLLTNGTYDNDRYIKGERPGEFKKRDYIVGEKEIGSSFETVEKDLNLLIDEINNTNLDDILTVVSYFHARFESIHPFADGNGRVGRTLMNYFLMINGYKPLIIYNEDKRLYYDCLHAYDDAQDLNPLKKFIEYEQDKTWKKKNISFHKLAFFTVKK